MMKEVGFFREMVQGTPEGPSLLEAVGGGRGQRVSNLVDYLRRSPVVFATSARADDVLNPRRREVTRMDIHTDGTYFWSEECAYYVETYGARLPQEFVDHVRRQPGAPRMEDLPDDVMDEVLAAMRGQA